MFVQFTKNFPPRIKPLQAKVWCFEITEWLGKNCNEQQAKNKMEPERNSKANVKSTGKKKKRAVRELKFDNKSRSADHSQRRAFRPSESLDIQLVISFIYSLAFFSPFSTTFTHSSLLHFRLVFFVCCFSPTLWVSSGLCVCCVQYICATLSFSFSISFALPNSHTHSLS